MEESVPSSSSHSMVDKTRRSSKRLAGVRERKQEYRRRLPSRKVSQSKQHKSAEDDHAVVVISDSDSDNAKDKQPLLYREYSPDPEDVNVKTTLVYESDKIVVSKVEVPQAQTVPDKEALINGFVSNDSDVKIEHGVQDDQSTSKDKEDNEESQPEPVSNLEDTPVNGSDCIAKTEECSEDGLEGLPIPSTEDEANKVEAEGIVDDDTTEGIVDDDTISPLETLHATIMTPKGDIIDTALVDGTGNDIVVVNMSYADNKTDDVPTDAEDDTKPSDHEALLSPAKEAVANDSEHQNQLSPAASEEDAAESDELPDIISCTACGKSYPPSKRQFCQHPALNVIVCKKCSKFYNSGRFSRDLYGIEEFCKWCADGGALICCDFCEKAFCEPCIKRNMSKAFLKKLKHAGELKWKCFSCDTEQIKGYQKQCRALLHYLEKMRKSETAFETKNIHLHGPSQSQRQRRLAKANEVISMQNDSIVAIADADEKLKPTSNLENDGSAKETVEDSFDANSKSDSDIGKDLQSCESSTPRASGRLASIATRLRRAAAGKSDVESKSQKPVKGKIKLSVADVSKELVVDQIKTEVKAEENDDLPDSNVESDNEVAEQIDNDNLNVLPSISDSPSSDDDASKRTLESSFASTSQEQKRNKSEKSLSGSVRRRRRLEKSLSTSSNSDSDSDGSMDWDQRKSSKSVKYNNRRRRKLLESETSSSGSSFLEEAIISKKKKNSRKGRRKKAKLESSEESDEEEKDTPSKGKRKNIRRIIKDDDLTEESKRARKLEEERRQRLLERTNAVLNESLEGIEQVDTSHLFFLEKGDDYNVVVHQAIAAQLKPHQKEGIQFLYDSTIESVKKWKEKDEGGGALLAHCMGLGKTLQVVALVHSLMTNKDINMKTALVVAPLNTVYNWQAEFEKWLPVDDRLDVSVLTDAKGSAWSRADMVSDWYEYGGILIVGYTMYRLLASLIRIKNKRQKKIFKESLVDPGPDICICDEGHILKNDKSALSVALNNIKTRRRVVLTGTPLQNNLNEYHVMVDFIKPKLLGTRKEFQNRFINPIHNGQCSDSTPFDVRVMKQRCHVLHQLLSGCVQRKDYSVLKPFLTQKHEYTIFVRLSPKQIQLYEKFLEKFVYHEVNDSRPTGRSLFSDYQTLMRIWSHPWGLKVAHLQRLEREKYDSLEEFLDDDEMSCDDDSTSVDEVSVSDDPSSGSDSSNVGSKPPSGRRKKSAVNQVCVSSDATDSSVESAGEGSSSRPVRNRNVKIRTRSINKNRVLLNNEVAGPSKAGASNEAATGKSTRSGTIYKEEDDEPIEQDKAWFEEILNDDDENDIMLSGKMIFLLEILADAEIVGDKVLVFSQSLISLDLIEKALGGGHIGGDRVNWCKGCDYFRMDGSTTAPLRQRWTDTFNDPDNPTARLFLISTRAGSLGVNMVAANRVIIFDCSWNPSHDVQSIFRVYRFGQMKPCYIYRLIAAGTMEEKIYDRQIRKLAMAGRVVDEQQIVRHFTDEEIKELYSFTAEAYSEDISTETPQLPKDPVLAEVLQRQHPKWIIKYHEHDVLLENVEEEELTEEERATAWKVYEQEKERASSYGLPRRTFDVEGDPSNLDGMVDASDMVQRMMYQQRLIREQLERERLLAQFANYTGAGRPPTAAASIRPMYASNHLHHPNQQPQQQQHGYPTHHHPSHNPETTYRMMQMQRLASQRSDHAGAHHLPAAGINYNPRAHVYHITRPHGHVPSGAVGQVVSGNRNSPHYVSP